MKILVTGCQRSGTRFYAQHLAKAHQIPFIDERDYKVHNYEKLQLLIRDKTSFCIHAPALKTIVTKFKKQYPDATIIWMYRDEQETVISMTKRKWMASAMWELAKLRPIIGEKLKGAFPPITQQKMLKNPFIEVIQLSKKLGELYLEQGIINELIDMASIEHLEGFVKSSFRRGK